MADVEVTLGPIPEEDFAVVADCFCAASPIPQQQVEVDGVPQFDDEGKAIMENTCTVLEHVVKGMIDYVRAVSEKGYKIKVLAGSPMDSELINRVLDNL
jgi:hypothetical protein